MQAQCAIVGEGFDDGLHMITASVLAGDSVDCMSTWELEADAEAASAEFFTPDVITEGESEGGATHPEPDLRTGAKQGAWVPPYPLLGMAVAGAHTPSDMDQSSVNKVTETTLASMEQKSGRFQPPDAPPSIAEEEVVPSVDLSQVRLHSRMSTGSLPKAVDVEAGGPRMSARGRDLEPWPRLWGSRGENRPPRRQVRRARRPVSVGVGASPGAVGPEVRRRRSGR